MVAWVILRMGPALISERVSTGSARFAAADLKVCQSPAIRLSMV